MAINNNAMLPVVVTFFAVQSILIYWANHRYYIDNDSATFTFPRSDVENNLFSILIALPYWNLMRRKTIKLDEVENIYIDTKRFTTNTLFVPTNKNGTRSKRSGAGKKQHVRYTLNVAGAFGSANLQFLDRQKRDELRNALQHSVKAATSRNIDRKVAEFS